MMGNAAAAAAAAVGEIEELFFSLTQDGRHKIRKGRK